MENDAATEGGPRLRNNRIAKIRVADLEEAPWNFRIHPDDQRSALSGLIDEIGFFGYPDVYEARAGVFRLCDGHLRKDVLIAKYGVDAEIEVNVTDFTEEEARKVTLTKDHLAGLAQADPAKLDELLSEVETDSDAVRQLLEDLAAENGLGEQSDEPIRLTPVDTKPPPKMAWLLVGIPLVSYGAIAGIVEQLAEVPDTILKTTVNDNDGSPPARGRKKRGK
jgi:hypothetical protein